MRDHRKLRAFQLADSIVMEVYRGTASIPRSEQFGLVAQMRRASISVASNIVEGSGRSSLAEYLRFIEIALGSARELEYQLDVAQRLGFWQDASVPPCSELCRLLSKLHLSLSTAGTPHSL